MKAVFLILLTGCSANGVSLNSTQAYFQDQMACVDAGGTREQIDSCRADAKAKYNAGILSDGGIHD